jgi:hypothetical protein
MSRKTIILTKQKGEKLPRGMKSLAAPGETRGGPEMSDEIKSP